MSTPATAARPAQTKPSQPTFWKRYSAHAECPISFAGSVLLHTLIPLGILLLVIMGPGRDGENNKPPQMDMVEIEGEGGGLGGTSVGPGSNSSGTPSHTEGPSSTTPEPVTASAQTPQFQLKDLPKFDLTMPPAWDDSVEPKDGDILAFLERERAQVEKILASKSNELTTKSGGAGGGGAGGPKGPGLGKGKGTSRGNSPTGGVLTDQQRHSLRWQINASYNGKEHLMKLQALKAVLVIPLSSQPGTALRFDMSKPGMAPQHIKLQLEEEKVRWFNTDQTELRSLAQELKLPEVPKVSIIYLPPSLEADMARRELAYQGAQENEIEKTIWDVRLIDGSYENTPQIVEQRLYKRGK
jgi:hypothetical protein